MSFTHLVHNSIELSERQGLLEVNVAYTPASQNAQAENTEQPEAPTTTTPDYSPTLSSLPSLSSLWIHPENLPPAQWEIPSPKPTTPIGVSLLRILTKSKVSALSAINFALSFGLATACGAGFMSLKWFAPETEEIGEQNDGARLALGLALGFAVVGGVMSGALHGIMELAVRTRGHKNQQADPFAKTLLLSAMTMTVWSFFCLLIAEAMWLYLEHQDSARGKAAAVILGIVTVLGSCIIISALISGKF
jgi:hypothetical protein